MNDNEKLVENHFKFGENWEKLIQSVDEHSLSAAVADLKEFMGVESLVGRSFLDIGCGSGLSSLAAYKLGAEKIVSVDIDPKNVANVDALKRKFNVPSNANWTAALVSIVEAGDLTKLPNADIVYSWGVLHHTGDMWNAIQNSAKLVKPKGQLYLMLYRDAHLAGLWKMIKWTYVKSPAAGQWLLRNLFAGGLLFGACLAGKNPFRIVRDYGKKMRGMTWYVDVTDWIGGYPFEYCSAEEVIEFLKPQGFHLQKITPKISKRPWGVRGTGSYTFLFEKTQGPLSILK